LTHYSPGLIVSGLCTIGLSYLRPADYDWNATRAIGGPTAAFATSATETGTGTGVGVDGEKGLDKTGADTTTVVAVTDGVDADADAASQTASDDEIMPEKAELQRIFVRAGYGSIAMATIIALLIPLPLFFTNYIFSKGFFTFWVAASFIWILLAGGVCM
jgi:hypothetical protein